MKYIIKNCPAFNVLTKQCKGAYSNYIEYQYCSGNDNCLLKQIVKKCRETIKIAESYKSEKVSYMQAMVDICNELLNLVEIEEVNE